MSAPFFSLPNSELLDRLGEELIVPDVVLPEVYFDNKRSLFALQPERKLMLAVLEAAVWIYRDMLIKMAKSTKGPRKNTRHFLRPSQNIEKNILECEEWFSNTDRNWPCSFENICNTLDLNQDYLRKGLENLKKAILNSKGAKTIYSKRHRSNNQSGIGRHIINIDRIF
ncbi:MAG: hypothetical protein Q8L47_03740 [bacterium]|nr:hypothetical protein [bacterium]